MICKGAQIVSLVAYKKGILERFKKGSKESGSGLISDGVVGKGVDLDFQLAKADSFEKEPTRNQALKQFLEEHAELKCINDSKYAQRWLDANEPRAGNDERYVVSPEDIERILAENVQEPPEPQS